MPKEFRVSLSFLLTSVIRKDYIFYFSNTDYCFATFISSGGYFFDTTGVTVDEEIGFVDVTVKRMCTGTSPPVAETIST